MRVRVKTKGLAPDFTGFYASKRRYPGDEFTLVARRDSKDKEITVEKQFSERWMEKIEPEKQDKKAAHKQ